MPNGTPPLVTRWAPLLLFDRNEDHFPGEPDRFRSESRFRQSNYRDKADRGWNRAGGRWEDGDHSGDDYLGTDWGTILRLVDQETKDLRPLGLQTGGKVTRPLDERNLWGSGDHRGFYLSWRGGLFSKKSGSTQDRPVPIFHDIDEIRTTTGRWTALHFWFFYVLNWCTIPTHEGDWEHITLYFADTAFEDGFRPSYVYFSAHEGGLLLEPGHAAMKWIETTHPSVYVLGGHASYPLVAREVRDRYTLAWRTWEQEIPKVEAAPWAIYDGAWGAAGPTTWTTGPLGPLFKRGRDIVENPRRKPKWNP
jgi:hypothetical protein